MSKVIIISGFISRTHFSLINRFLIYRDSKNLKNSPILLRVFLASARKRGNNIESFAAVVPVMSFRLRACSVKNSNDLRQ